MTAPCFTERGRTRAPDTASSRKPGAAQEVGVTRELVRVDDRFQPRHYLHRPFGGEIRAHAQDLPNGSDRLLVPAFELVLSSEREAHIDLVWIGQANPLHHLQGLRPGEALQSTLRT